MLFALTKRVRTVGVRPVISFPVQSVDERRNRAVEADEQEQVDDHPGTEEIRISARLSVVA